MNPLEIETHHIWSRCVRGAFLLGVDPETGMDVSHRRAMLESLTEYQASVFAVDWGTDHYLTNHLHGVGRSRPDIAQRWSDEEVAWRWKMAWPAYDGSRGWWRAPTDEEVEELLRRDEREPGHLQKLRCNLSNLSWFIARIKQPISYLANRDEANKKEKRGHFWEGRYGNRKLTSFRDTLNSFLYNDVQQVRAGIVDRLEDSDYSAIQRQLQAVAAQAFRDMHQRKPGDKDEDLAELERIQALFGNCYYSPLDANAPLMTEADDDPPPSELVLPAGYYHRPPAVDAQVVAVEGPVESEEFDENVGNDEEEGVEDFGERQFGSEEAGDDSIEADSLLAVEDGSVSVIASREEGTDEQSPRRRRTRTGQSKSRGKRRGKRKRRSIHNRLKRKQRRRASRSSILGIDAQQYLDLVRTLAERIVAERGDDCPAIASEPSSGDPRDAEPDETPPTFYRSLKNFSVWAYSQVAEQIETLVASQAELPRPPT